MQSRDPLDFNVASTYREIHVYMCIYFNCLLRRLPLSGYGL